MKGQAIRMRILSVSYINTTKVNAAFYFAAAFLVLWVPFGIIAIAATKVPDRFYKDVFDAGYTVAYGSFAVTPLVYSLTDRDFKNFVKRKYKKVATKATKAYTLPTRPVTSKMHKLISPDQIGSNINSKEKAETI